MKTAQPAIVWFRRDLRLEDNAALAAAVGEKGPVIPVFIWDEASEGRWVEGGASRWWLHHSLTALDASLRERRLRLIVAAGPVEPTMLALARSAKAGSVHWNRRYEPEARASEQRLEAALQQGGFRMGVHNSTLLFEPGTVANRSGKPFQVFSPFWRHCLTLEVPEPVKLPKGSWLAPDRWPKSLPIAELKLLPKIRWDAGFGPVWTPGEAGAQARLKQFLRGGIERYDVGRNQPGVDGTSRLSPWLHFGEIGPRQIWAAVRKRAKGSGVFPAAKADQVYLNEIGWREFAYQLLHHFPHTPTDPLREAFARFPWAKDPGGVRLKAWQRGRTGYPIVDAGMRQLWATGWMHNRVRMIVGSFLVKHLRQPWQAGAEWFWDTLVDADLANNTLNWQWSAGCGADAAPYFRIFAPVLQGRKFDPSGDYVRRWVPELKALPNVVLHAPWEADPAVLQGAGVELGRNYPRPIVDHAEARAGALAALKQLRTNQP